MSYLKIFSQHSSVEDQSEKP